MNFRGRNRFRKNTMDLLGMVTGRRRKRNRNRNMLFSMLAVGAGVGSAMYGMRRTNGLDLGREVTERLNRNNNGQVEEMIDQVANTDSSREAVNMVRGGLQSI
ncbi:hypothetical protein [Bacillus marinisedimentorum]|uniref:hypothetical protein n=1 Tax=Bacillus marinisedimentorum TaxID=1821260 RepID=UPI0007DF60B8|nr:hypothetical protein [Bacillus marinisedimentorum]